ncbi:anti-sigma factor family protein [Pararhizobium antarcticum]|uniref:Fis family transcriptional regulator n=1 Tax=Pararhizobium antarcticum TaxID=1798805 RepID=A0A657LMJ7_9HYPH|nr:anti-sigma factor [Pararhizobium antarcticum]OJF92254.1 Fis family transcriptional regulator [Pararhizobium antarcticum]
MINPDPILESDLDAYVDNRLAPGARIRVESHLSKNPAEAARIMADLEIRSTLRIAIGEHDAPHRAETREAARRLESNLSMRRTWATLQRIAAIGILVTTGWVASSQIGPFNATAVNASVHAPAYVEEAIRAHNTSLLRASMTSQREAPGYDAEDIRAATAIVMPKLPGNWKVADVQIFPSDFGPSVEMAIAVEGGGQLSLFAVRPGFFAVENVTDVNLSDAEAAYWQIGEVAYALVSSVPDATLAAEARDLSKTLY